MLLIMFFTVTVKYIQLHYTYFFYTYMLNQLTQFLNMFSRILPFTNIFRSLL
jgi:hypothetical protein